jgi:hypothetical protein
VNLLGAEKDGSMAAKQFLLLIALGAAGPTTGCASPAVNESITAAPGAASKNDATPKSYTVPGMSRLVVGGPSTDSG